MPFSTPTYGASKSYTDREILPNYNNDYPLRQRKSEGIGSLSLCPHPNAINPVLTAASVTDITATFVADPFIVYENGKYYMFFEAYETSTSLGRIGLATSDNGVQWTYQSIVLSIVGKHLAYPNVFKVDGVWYMLPDYTGPGLKLYSTTTFPTGWTECATLIATGQHIDPTVWYWNGLWYLMTYNYTAKTCTLRYASSITSTSWTTHPASPIISGENVRGGGKPIVYPSGIDLVIQTQENSQYGEKTYIHRITELTTTTCTIVKQNAPLIFARKTGDWHEIGMHQADFCLGQGNSMPIVAVDGCNYLNNWSIGIYTIGKPEPYIFKGTIGSDQTIAPGAWRRFNFTASDSGIGTFDDANDVLTITRDGVYFISWNVTWDITDIGTGAFRTNILINKNTSTELFTDAFPVSVAKRHSSHIKEFVYLKAGDTLDFNIYHDSSVNQTIQHLTQYTAINIFKL